MSENPTLSSPSPAETAAARLPRRGEMGPLLPVGSVAALLVVLTLGGLEFGHQLGASAAVGTSAGTELAAPILAVVGLLLGFAFSMAGERYGRRQAAQIREFNSIGTFWLRTRLVPEPARSEMRARVRRYVALHLEHRAAGTDPKHLVALEREAGRLQTELWGILAELADTDLEARRLLLLTPALNAMFDDTSSALAARLNRLPTAMYLYLVGLSVLAAALVGYRPGEEERNLVVWAVFAFVVSGALLILNDLDRPRSGLIQTSSALYTRLLETMREDV